MQRADVPIHNLIHEKQRRAIAYSPHNSENKYSAYVIRDDANSSEEGSVRIYLKGAPEVILQMCSRCFDYNGDVAELDEE